MSQLDSPITSGNGRVPVVPAATEMLPGAEPGIKSAKIAKRVRKAVGSNAARPQMVLSAPVETRIRANGRMTSVEMPHIRPDESPGHDKLPPNRRDVLISLPRRSQNRAVTSKEWTPARMKMATIPKVGLPMLWARGFVWMTVIVEFALGTMWATLLRRDSRQRRAVRLRRAVEKRGGTLVKIGRHMAFRVDILPVSNREQLHPIRDRNPPFPRQ